MSVVITDVLPISTTYQSCSPAPCGLNAGNVISWSVGTLGVREAAAVTLLARVNSDVVFCYSAAFRAEEITEGLGITDAATISRFRSARLRVAATAQSRRCWPLGYSRMRARDDIR